MLNTAFLVVISYRNVGFRGFLEGDERKQMIETDSRHQGLNMMQELCLVNDFTQMIGPAYGARYLQDLINVVPRAIWPSKPLLGIDYAVWRGFEGGTERYWRDRYDLQRTDRRRSAQFRRRVRPRGVRSVNVDLVRFACTMVVTERVADAMFSVPGRLRTHVQSGTRHYLAGAVAGHLWVSHHATD